MSAPQARVTIESLCSRVTSGGTPSRANARYWEGASIPWVKTGELHDGYIEDTEEYITESAVEESSAKIFPANTVLMAMYGDGRTITSLGILRGPAATNQACCAMLADPSKCDFRYLFYALKHHRRELLGRVVAGAQRNLSGGIIRNFTITWWPLREQGRIADTLMVYDNLIAVNERRIKLLEQSVRLLFKEWFVHLRYPGHTHNEVVDGVPRGWTIRKFSDLVDFKEGPGLRNYQYREHGIPFLNIRTFGDDEIDLSKTQHLDESEVAAKYRHFLVEEDDHVVSSSGTLGRVVTIRKCHLPLMLNTSVIRMRPKRPMMKWFLKAYLKHGTYLQSVTAMATGAAQLNYGPMHLKILELPMPNEALVQEFENIVTPIYLQIKTLLDMIAQLRKGRDLLLPQLMDGRLSV